VRALAIALAATAPAWAAEDGAAIYAENCAVCHQADGQGAAGVAPSLAGTLARYAGSDDGRRYLAQIVVSGMAGPIQTDAGPFRGLMPSFRGRLDDAQIAAVVNRVLAEWNAAAAPVVTEAAVAQAEAAEPAPSATRALREQARAAGP
jgi:mono/diheme cytochrome c family protein